MKSEWHVELLGHLRARSGDRTLTRFRTQKTGLLLAYLAFHAGRPQRRDLLVELLWPDSDLDNARRCLRVELTWLRHHLEGAEVPTGTVLVSDRTSVRLNAEAVTTDVSAFQEAFRMAARGASKRGARGDQLDARWLTRAVECYGGELLPGYVDEWVRRERAWLAERYFEALGHLLGHLQRVGEFERAVEYARQGVTADPLREAGEARFGASGSERQRRGPGPGASRPDAPLYRRGAAGRGAAPVSRAGAAPRGGAGSRAHARALAREIERQSVLLPSRHHPLAGPNVPRSPPWRERIAW